MVGRLKNKTDGDTWIIIIIFIAVFVVGYYIGYAQGKKDTTADARLEYSLIIDLFNQQHQVVKDGCTTAQNMNDWEGCFKMLNILAKKHIPVYD